MEQKLTNLLVKAGVTWCPRVKAKYLIDHDVVQIVRCADCQYRKEWIKNGLNEYSCRKSGLRNLTEKSFCPHGKLNIKAIVVDDTKRVAIDKQGNRLDFAIFDDEITLTEYAYTLIKETMNALDFDFVTAKNYLEDQGII